MDFGAGKHIFSYEVEISPDFEIEIFNSHQGVVFVKRISQLMAVVMLDAHMTTEEQLLEHLVSNGKKVKIGNQHSIPKLDIPRRSEQFPENSLVGVVRVEGMLCGTCVTEVESSLLSQYVVADAYVSILCHLAVIRFVVFPETKDLENLCDAVNTINNEILVDEKNIVLYVTTTNVAISTLIESLINHHETYLKPYKASGTSCPSPRKEDEVTSLKFESKDLCNKVDVEEESIYPRGVSLQIGALTKSKGVERSGSERDSQRLLKDIRLAQEISTEPYIDSYSQEFSSKDQDPGAPFVDSGSDASSKFADFSTCMDEVEMPEPAEFMHLVHLKINGMTCASCARNLKDLLGAISNDPKRTFVNFMTKKAQIVVSTTFEKLEKKNLQIQINDHFLDTKYRVEILITSRLEDGFKELPISNLVVALPPIFKPSDAYILEFELEKVTGLVDWEFSIKKKFLSLNFNPLSIGPRDLIFQIIFKSAIDIRNASVYPSGDTIIGMDRFSSQPPPKAFSIFRDQQLFWISLAVLSFLLDSYNKKLIGYLSRGCLINFFVATYVLFDYGYSMMKGGVISLRNWQFNMDVLVTLAVLSAYLFSIVTSIFKFFAFPVFRDINSFYSTATLITVIVNFGKSVEAKAVRATSSWIDNFTKTSAEYCEAILSSKFPIERYQSKYSFEMDIEEPLDSNPNEKVKLPLSLLQVGDTVILRKDVHVPCDGELQTDGVLWVVEHVLTGELNPIPKTNGDLLLAGSTVAEGFGNLKVSRVGAATILQKTILQSQNSTKTDTASAYSQIIDVAARYFVISAICMSQVAFWFHFLRLYGGSISYALEYSITRMITVLVASCPCPFGLASPIAVSFALGKAVKHGMFFRTSAALEKLEKVTDAVFDKTGTLTTGDFRVRSFLIPKSSKVTLSSMYRQRSLASPEDTTANILSMDALLEYDSDVEFRNLTELSLGNLNEAEEAIIFCMWSLVLGLEQYSSHPLAYTLRQDAFSYCPASKVEDLRPAKLMNVSSSACGVWGNLVSDGRKICIGSREFVKTFTRSFTEENSLLEISSEVDKQTFVTSVFLATSYEVLARIDLGDKLRPNARPLIEKLQSNSVKTFICSGDTEGPVVACAAELLISPNNIRCSLSPQEKGKYVTSLKANLSGHNSETAEESDNRCVIFVGDGTNDAPALMEADIGISLGVNSIYAMGTSDVVIGNTNLLLIDFGIQLSKRLRRAVAGNVAYAVLYNVIMIPLAGGFFPYVTLPPALASFCMSLSCLTVVFFSSLMLRD
eukprot:GHVP01067261.1.p1 GENE.GHVP01067261.1~~GHVP01067261.1.p1  ORF type:complete len:1273 (+),score=207.55 GHVP01067261.1:1491-5309(+)